MLEINSLIIIYISAFFLLFSKELHSTFVYISITCVIIYIFQDEISNYLKRKQFFQITDDQITQKLGDLLATPTNNKPQSLHQPQIVIKKVQNKRVH